MVCHPCNPYGGCIVDEVAAEDEAEADEEPGVEDVVAEAADEETEEPDEIEEEDVLTGLEFSISGLSPVAFAHSAETKRIFALYCTCSQ